MRIQGLRVFWVLIITVGFTGCFKKNELDCDWNSVKAQGAPRQPVVQHSVVLQRKEGKWIPEQLLRVKALSHRAPVEVLKSLAPDPIFQPLPPTLGETLPPFMNLSAFYDQALEGARFVVNIPTLPFGLENLVPLKSLEPTSNLPIEPLHWSGDPRYRYNFVILGDGFTRDQLPLYQRQARELVDELLTQHSPFSDYKDLINIIRVDAVSEEAGASCDEGTYSIKKNRYGSTFPVACYNALTGAQFNDRFLHQWNVVQLQQDAHSVRYDGTSIVDMILVLVHSKKYGGSAVLWATITDSTPYESSVHEFGHSIGHLGEEYLVEGDICHWETVFAANNSLEVKSVQDLKWKDWVLKDTPIPTPAEEAYSGRIGMYQGAGGGCKTQFYRPAQECRMSSHTAEFCSVCKEQLILRLYDRMNPLQSELQLNSEGVFASVVRGDRLRTRWFVDGRLVQDTPSYLPLPGLSYVGHEVRLVVSDDQAPVKRDRCHLVFATERQF